MLYAVTIEPLAVVLFTDEPPEGGNWDVEEGVSLDLPFNYAAWPEGSERPRQILCRLKSDPKYYKVFRYPREIPPEYEPTGKSFGGFLPGPAWPEFARALSGAVASRATADDEPPGATDEALRALGVNRQVVMRRALPFAVEIPNAKTRKALADVDAGRGLTSYADVDAMFRDLGP